MKNLIQIASEGAAQVDNLYEDMQIEDLICQGELDYVERQMQKMQMEDLLCAAEAEEVERKIQMEDLLTQVGYGWR